MANIDAAPWSSTPCALQNTRRPESTLAILLLAKLQRSLCGPLVVIVVDSGDSISPVS